MQHIIQYQLFEVEFPHAAGAYDLQTKISNIFNEKLTVGMEQLFDRVVPGNSVLTLGDVSIDVGSIAYNDLDDTLADKVLAELERELRRRLLLTQANTNDNSTNEESFKTVETNYTALLEHFLLTGTMPWWATGDLMLDPTKVMEYLLAHDAGRLKQMITTAGQHAYVRQRLVYQFSEELIRGIIALLEPAEAGFIFEYHSTTVKIHQEEKLISSATGNEFESALWLFILTYILVDRGSLFNQRAFIRSTLTQMAAHYNREYAEVLTILNQALNDERLKIKHTGYLPAIILQLFAEETDNRSVTPEMELQGRYDGETPNSRDIELMRHYIAFGSLPWWAEPYTASDMIKLFLSIVGASPKTLKNIIIATGQSDEVRKRITTVFNDEAIAAIVTLLEPSNAPFIINYVTEVQQLHIKKTVVKADSNDFKKAVWKFVLDFLLVERGSEFNQRMFLQSNIRSLAVHYNVKYSDMLTYLVQSVGQIHQDSLQYAPLFRLLASILHDAEHYTPAMESITPKGRQKQKDALGQETRNVQLKDVLLHWLKYGNMAWWAKDHFDQTPAMMLETLLATAPHEATLLLKFASTDPTMQLRVIYQIPPGLIANVFALYPQGNEAITLYGYLMVAIKKIGSIDQLEAEKLLLILLWDVYITGRYNEFSVGTYLRSTVQYLSSQYNIEPARAVNALRATLKTTAGHDYINVLDQLSAEPYYLNNAAILLGKGTADLYTAIGEYLSANEAFQRSAIINEAYRVLAYYLANNKLPDQFKGTNPAYINAVVKQLLQLLNSDNSARLKQFVEDKGRKELYEQIGEDGAQTLIAGGIEQMILGYHDKQGPLHTDAAMTEALRILEYYLVNGVMPEYLKGVDIGTALKQILLLLNYERPAALNSLLQKDGHNANARMQLHNVFVLTGSTAENNVARSLKEHFEHDVLLFIKGVQATGFAAGGKLPQLLTPYLSRPGDNAAFIFALLKHAAIDRFIAANYGNDLVYDLLNDNDGLVGGRENIEWLKQVQQFFNSKFTDTLLRDRFDNLFREFNLLILGGHITAKTPEEYVRGLLRFISSANNALFVQMSVIIKTTENGAALSTAIKRSLFLKQFDTQHQNEKEVAGIKQLLSKGDEEVLKRFINDVPEQKIMEPADTEVKRNLDSKDTIYINNAGLVLLNPFFATYFVRLGMMHEGKFIDKDMQLRAIHLLQYLVNGSEQAPEHELVLNKILCNVPVTEPIPLMIVLTDKERTISEELLKEVLARWDKLNNTTVAGLQGSFLQRDGSLVFKEEAWHLRVEQRGYDILLQTLPWNIGMIKAPWMDNFLYVEWT